MSARAFERILRVARTVADLEASFSLEDDPASESYQCALEAAVTAPVLSRHIAEAIGYRNLDRGNWGQIF